MKLFDFITEIHIIIFIIMVDFDIIKFEVKSKKI